jgi:CDP-diacylglycerol--glycerol-3-phosphate 3-phosphatidyltransferase
LGAGPLFDGRIKDAFSRLLSPLISLLMRAGADPNAITVMGLIMSALAGVAFGAGHFTTAAVLIALSGLCDFLDGQIARRTNKASPFGAFLDSTLDRMGEGLILLGLAWYFSGGLDSSAACPWTIGWIVLSLEGSFMVSYTRARAEGLGIECKGGLMQRPERMVLLTAGALLAATDYLGAVAMKATLFLLALLSNLTAVDRIRHIRRLLWEKMQNKRWNCKEATKREGPQGPS